MKDNLGTFPVKSTPQAYEAWKKRFEKELRELLTTKYPHSAILKEIFDE